MISGSKVLFGSKIVQCFEEQSFGQLLSQIEGELFAEKQVASVKIGEGKQHEVQLDAPLKLCCSFNCNAIEYHLKPEVPVAPPSRNAREILMSRLFCLATGLTNSYSMTSLTCLLLGMWDGHQIQSRL